MIYVNIAQTNYSIQIVLKSETTQQSFLQPASLQPQENHDSLSRRLNAEVLQKKSFNKKKTGKIKGQGLGSYPLDGIVMNNNLECQT